MFHPFSIHVPLRKDFFLTGQLSTWFRRSVPSISSIHLPKLSIKMSGSGATFLHDGPLLFPLSHLNGGCRGRFGDFIIIVRCFW
jgi:hypothetical protein